ncbi:Oxidoreductase FAD/NAD(P)-binding, partial [Trinorchestia longiramus]
VKVGGSGCGKVSIEVQKAEANVRWTNIGRTLPGNQELISIDTRQRLYHSCRLYRKQQLTHDIVLLSVQCPPGLYLPVPSGYHTFLRTPGAPALSKPYTPVPENLDPAVWAAEVAAPGNCLHYLVKVYPDGDMSQALDSVTVSPDPIWNSDPSSDSSVVEITLAEGEHVERLSRGEDEEEMTQKNEEEPPVTDVALLAAGTGITPMLSTLLDCIILKRRVRLLFFNKTEDDVPWRDELDVLAAENSDIIKVHHVLSSGGSAWSGLKGRVSLDLLERMLPVADGTRSVMLAVCGPTGFTDLTLKLLDGLGYLKEEYHAFVGTAVATILMTSAMHRRLQDSCSNLRNLTAAMNLSLAGA